MDINLPGLTLSLESCDDYGIPNLCKDSQLVNRMGLKVSRKSGATTYSPQPFNNVQMLLPNNTFLARIIFPSYRSVQRIQHLYESYTPESENETLTNYQMMKLLLNIDDDLMLIERRAAMSLIEMASSRRTGTITYNHLVIGPQEGDIYTLPGECQMSILRKAFNVLSEEEQKACLDFDFKLKHKNRKYYMIH